jgi:hypothetical protein
MDTLTTGQINLFIDSLKTTIGRGGVAFSPGPIQQPDTLRLASGILDNTIYWSGSNTKSISFDSIHVKLNGPDNNVPWPLDSTNFKILVRRVSDSAIYEMSWPTFGGGGGGGSSGVALDSVQTYTSGTTLTQLAGANIIQLNPTTTQASLTITTQGNAGTWHNGNYLIIVAGGTLGQGNTVVTSLSIAAGTGMTINEAVIPKIIMAGESIVFKRIGNNLYRIN